MGVTPEAKTFYSLPNPFVNARIPGRGSQLHGFTTRVTYHNLVNRSSNTVTTPYIINLMSRSNLFPTLWGHICCYLNYLSPTVGAKLGCFGLRMVFLNLVLPPKNSNHDCSPLTAHLLFSSPFPSPPPAVGWK